MFYGRTSTRMSMRSRSGPEILLRYLRIAAAEARPRSASPKPPLPGDLCPFRRHFIGALKTDSSSAMNKKYRFPPGAAKWRQTQSKWPTFIVWQ